MPALPNRPTSDSQLAERSSRTRCSTLLCARGRALVQIEHEVLQRRLEARQIRAQRRNHGWLGRRIEVPPRLLEPVAAADASSSAAPGSCRTGAPSLPIAVTSSRLQNTSKRVRKALSSAVGPSRHGAVQPMQQPLQLEAGLEHGPARFRIGLQITLSVRCSRRRSVNSRLAGEHAAAPPCQQAAAQQARAPPVIIRSRSR